jgi:uncharacterized paraquat-inducible protein A
MPYLRCPSCDLLAHVIAPDDTTVIHCPRCRAAERQTGLGPLEESVQEMSAPPGQDPKPARS